MTSRENSYGPPYVSFTTLCPRGHVRGRGMEYRFRGRCSCCERRPRWALRRRAVPAKADVERCCFYAKMRLKDQANPCPVRVLSSLTAANRLNTTTRWPMSGVWATFHPFRLLNRLMTIFSFYIDKDALWRVSEMSPHGKSKNFCKGNGGEDYPCAKKTCCMEIH